MFYLRDARLPLASLRIQRGRTLDTPPKKLAVAQSATSSVGPYNSNSSTAVELSCSILDLLPLLARKSQLGQGRKTPHLKSTPPLKVALLVEPTPFTHISGYSNRFREMLK